MRDDYLKTDGQNKNFNTIPDFMTYISKDTLKAKHKLQDKNKASGIDGISKKIYEDNIDENLGKLVKRMKEFSYKPQPVKRVYIPKPGSDKGRALGIPSYEDKLIQGVMADILDTIYELEFKDFSYGFRIKRSCHDAIRALNTIITTKDISYIVDADIKGFFDNVNHDKLIKFLERTIEDKNFIRYIKRFLMSGIMEQGKYIKSDKGTPQGGLISPILSNIYLHYVLDTWFADEITSRCKGEAHIIRYADDFVCCFEYEEEARKFFGMLKERIESYDLELAEEKSNIIEFGRESNVGTTFDFLGFTHKNGMNKSGEYIIMNQTAVKNLNSKKLDIKQWINEHLRVDSKEDLIKEINMKLKGHYNYYGVKGNMHKVKEFKMYVQDELFKAFNRDGQKMSRMNYKRLLKQNPLAKPKVCVSLLQS